MDKIVEMQARLDAYRAMRELRLEEQRKVDKMKEEENGMQNALVSYLKENPEVNGIIGRTHKALIKEATVPIIEDLHALRDYIVANDAWDLVSVRLSAPAVRERWDVQEEVPGVGSIVETKLSVTKL